MYLFEKLGGYIYLLLRDVCFPTVDVFLEKVQTTLTLS